MAETNAKVSITKLGFQTRCDVIGVYKSSIFCPLHFYYLCSRAIFIFIGNMLEQCRMRCTTILMILEGEKSQVSSPCNPLEWLTLTDF